MVRVHLPALRVSRFRRHVLRYYSCNRGASSFSRMKNDGSSHRPRGSGVPAPDSNAVFLRRVSVTMLAPAPGNEHSQIPCLRRTRFTAHTTLEPARPLWWRARLPRATVLQGVSPSFNLCLVPVSRLTSTSEPRWAIHSARVLRDTEIFAWATNHRSVKPIIHADRATRIVR